MTLRTPRRRISPRAKRRYRAIREFFRRALGTSSQPDIKISSTIAVNVTELKHRIIGIEHQLNEVNKHCQDIASLENSFRREAENFQAAERRSEKQLSEKQPSHSSGRQLSSQGVKALYKQTETQHGKSDENEYIYNVQPQEVNECRRMPERMPECTTEPPVTLESYHAQLAKIKKAKKLEARKKQAKEYEQNISKHRSPFTTENLSPYLTSSYQSASHDRIKPQYVAPPSPPSPQRGSKHRYKEQYPSQPQHTERHEADESRRRKHRDRKRKHRVEATPSWCYHETHNRKDRVSSVLDRDFIADIIRRQYQPVKLFGRRGSDLSQFSAPVCRDHEYHRIRNNIQEGSELCSCCYDDRQCEFSDIRSVCDTRLYSSKRHSRHSGHRRHEDIYNDANYYDVIPVKEKTSPKSRRKFVEDNVFGHQYTCYPYKEVPPSPRTQRPRLNLKTQLYQDYDDIIQVRQPIQRIIPRTKKEEEYYAVVESDNTSEVVPVRYQREQPLQKPVKIMTCAQIHEDSRTCNQTQYHQYINDESNTVNQPQANISPDTDKTDRALCEIKDILQNFLQEIKRDSSQSQCDKSEVCTKQIDKQTSNVLAEIPNGMVQNKCTSFVAPASAPPVPPTPLPAPLPAPSFVPSYPGPCCYPMVCPVNYLQNGFVVPSQSVIACHACVNTTKEPVCTECSSKPKDKSNQENNEGNKNNEIEDLIKEIYKYVAKDQKPGKKRIRNNNKERSEGISEESDRDKDLTSRSIGDSVRMSRQDAKVGTPELKCYSKSCEAIGSRVISDNYYTTTQSDTVLEKLSLEVTTDSSTRLSTMSVLQDKNKVSKLVKVLKSVGIIKKKKKEETPEGLSENESATDMDVQHKHTHPPYRQNITNYMMHGQEYYHRPPVPPYVRPEYAQPPYDQRAAYYHQHHMAPESGEFTPHRVHQQTILEHSASTGHYQQPSAPPYPGPFEAPCGHGHVHGPYPPQPPLCLKEVEVKSTSTQSEKKFSFFNKRPRKSQRPSTARVRTFRSDHDPRNCSTQTGPMKKTFFQYEPQKKEKISYKGFLSSFKNLQKGDFDVDENPTTFGYKTHKRLADGDLKMRNVLLKKLFYKRNPFSPRNLIVRTLLGKDKASYGAPPVLKTRLFF